MKILEAYANMSSPNISNAEICGKEECKRVGIFGGSFDPIHFGHLAIAQAVIDKHLADEVWLMVSPLNPLKVGRKPAGEDDRLEMARIAVASLAEEYREHIKVSDFETRLPKPSYTINTLRALQKEFPECEFRIICGEDNLHKFDKWRASEEILRDFGLIVYPRADLSEEFKVGADKLLKEEERGVEQKRGKGVVVLEGVKLFEQSSTSIRRLLADGGVDCVDNGMNNKEDIFVMLPEGVYEYIQQNRLYTK